MRQRFYVSGLFKCKGCGPADRSHDAGDADEQTHFEISPDDQILRRIGDQDEEAHCDRLHGQHEDHRQRRAEEEVFHTEHESGLPHCQRCDGEKEPANNTDPGGFIREEGQQLAASDTGGLFNAPDFYMNKLAAPPAAKGKVDIRNSATENLKILSDCLGLSIDELTVVVMDRTRHKDLIKEIRGCGAKVQPISDGDVQAAIACGFAGTGTHCLMGIGAAPEGVISAAAMRALGGHFQGQLVYDPAIAQTSEWADYTKEGNIKRLNEMGITDIDKIYEANELASGENVVFAGSGITDGLLFDGVKFERDCVRTSSLVISTLDSTARFTNTVHIKDGAKSISL